jgi:hypothetical protein
VLAFDPVNLEQVEQQLRLVSTPSVPLPAPNFSTSSCSPISSERTGSVSSGATHRAAPFAELLIDCEEDRTLRAVLVGMLREADRSGPGRR